jgi:hypothetical protein
VLQVIETGQEGGAGNLVICEVLRMHIDDSVLNEHGKIDPHKIDLVARMGGDYYCRASGSAVFEVAKPNLKLGVGVDALPERIRNSTVLSGNHLGILGNCTEIPATSTIENDGRLEQILSDFSDGERRSVALHHYAKDLLDEGEIDKAWQVLLVGS